MLAFSLLAISFATPTTTVPTTTVPTTTVTTPLPSLDYAFTSFATAAPVEAAAFCETYFGATVLAREQFIAHTNASSRATVSGVRFPYDSGRAYHDVYFVNDPSKPVGALNTTAYMSQVHGAHRFDVQETWDWFQDWHLCLSSDNVDLVVARLLRDGKPIVTRSSYSFYVELPHGITVQVLGTKMRLAWSEPFNFCRYTSFPPPEMHAQPLQLAALPDPLPPVPELPPAHHSFFSTKPEAALNFTRRHLGAELYNMSGVWRESHRYSDGRCALLAWAQLPQYQLHFVKQDRKTSGPGGSGQVAVTPPTIEKYLETLHGAMRAQDGFFDNRVGFFVGSLPPFQQSLEAAGEPYLLEREGSRNSLYLQLPGGIIVQLLEKAGDV